MKFITQLIKQSLRGYYSSTEIDSFIKIIVRDILGYTLLDLYLDKDIELTLEQEQKIKEIIGRLLRYEPIQYIAGKVEFYGRNFFVTSGVLVPRPETEELVDIIIKENKDSAPIILDIGTGSGCIAISLFEHLNSPETIGWDISEVALEVARKNSDCLRRGIRFEEVNVLDFECEEEKYDLIVSNPPYVMETEKTYMEPNVLDWEPHGAIFVEDNDPLVFYRVISEKARKMLSENGKIYFEINPLFWWDIEEMMKKLGYRNIHVIKDLSGKERFIKADK